MTLIDYPSWTRIERRGSGKKVYQRSTGRLKISASTIARFADSASSCRAQPGGAAAMVAAVSVTLSVGAALAVRQPTDVTGEPLLATAARVRNPPPAQIVRHVGDAIIELTH